MLASALDFLSPGAEITFWNVIVAMAVSGTCALVGGFLVLRRLSLLGDAISHAVLPGLVIGFMISGTRDLTPMLIGALAAALLTTYLTHTLTQRGRVESDASMGVVFTSLFAVGVILITKYHSQVDLDPGCVLYGQLEAVALDLVPLWGTDLEVPRQLIPLVLLGSLNLCLVLLFWKELKIVAFDPALATTLGISTTVIHYLLMIMVAGTTVTSFESVGSILVIAMLIVPGATAQLLTDRLSTFLMVSVASGWVAAISGYWAADRWDLNAAGTMTAASGTLFLVAVACAPQYGLLPRWFRNRALGFRILQEDLLAHLYRYEERELVGSTAPGSPGPTSSFAGQRVWSQRLAIAFLKRRRLLRNSQGLLRLTPRGSERARHLIRTHRLWESYLSQTLDLPLDHLHEPAHRMEHFLPPELTDRIEEKLEAPDQDPHGRAIP